MSFGSISHEAHSTLAVAMNRIGGKSNSGEGGEDAIRYTPQPNGDSECSAIKQIASGRFGVTAHYITNDIDLQIKMAQGDKPGECGQLPGHKVDDWIGRVRHATPGVGLISPPPHPRHLLHRGPRPTHLRPEAGQPECTTASSCLYRRRRHHCLRRSQADTVLISAWTAQAPRHSAPSNTQACPGNWASLKRTKPRRSRLRDRILVQADGMIRTGRDLAIATLLGAEEWGVATAALIAEGRIMMRKCHEHLSGGHRH